MFAIKAIGISYLVKKGAETAPSAYNFFSSTVKLSEKRKADIEERRGQLKIMADDPLVVQIIKQELLAYKPNPFTLDDRYLQLEQILDAIEQAKTTKQTAGLIAICEKVAKDMALSPGIKNAFLVRLASANARIQAVESKPCQARL